MKLDDFIEETLVNISEGVRKANSKLAISEGDSEAIKLFKLEPGNNKSDGVGIAFDVAITTQRDDTKKKGGKLKVAVFEADLSGNYAEHNKNVSRVQFSVCITNWHG